MAEPAEPNPVESPFSDRHVAWEELRARMCVAFMLEGGLEQWARLAAKVDPELGRAAIRLHGQAQELYLKLRAELKRMGTS